MNVAGQAGLQLAANKVGPQWVITAAKLIRLYAAATMPGAFLVEDVRRWVDYWQFELEQPDNKRAWGAAVRYARQAGWIKQMGYGPAQTSNGSPKCQWVST